MKKFAIVAAALALVGMVAAPAMAEFTPYMSVRFHTDVHDTDQDTDLRWYLAGNSRLGGKFATDDLTGGFEFGTGVNLRLLYANYKFGEMGTLMVGQHYNPYTNFSDQALNGDQGAVGYGALYDGRQPQIRFTMPMGLSISLITPKGNGVKTGTAYSLNTKTGAIEGKPAVTGDIDTYMPKIALAYNLKLDPVSFGLNGAVNSIKQKVDGKQKTITSGLISAKVAANAGPVALKGNVYYGQNLANFGIITISPMSGDAAGLPSAGATLNKKGDGIEDTTTFGGWLQAGFDTGMAKIGAGVGYVTSDNDTYKDADAQMTYWVNANIPVAKTFFIVPEFSYFDQMDDTKGVEEDDAWMLGAKWQMNL